MNDKDFLWWLADRLVMQHGENPNVDFVRKLVSIAEAAPIDQITPNTKSYISEHLRRSKAECEKLARNCLGAYKGYRIAEIDIDAPQLAQNIQNTVEIFLRMKEVEARVGRRDPPSP